MIICRFNQLIDADVHVKTLSMSCYSGKYLSTPLVLDLAI